MGVRSRRGRKSHHPTSRLTSSLGFRAGLRSRGKLDSWVEKPKWKSCVEEDKAREEEGLPQGPGLIQVHWVLSLWRLKSFQTHPSDILGFELSLYTQHCVYSWGHRYKWDPALKLVWQGHSWVNTNQTIAVQCFIGEKSKQEQLTQLSMDSGGEGKNSQSKGSQPES